MPSRTLKPELHGIIVVGATTISGGYADFTQGRHDGGVVWAPGVDVKCAGVPGLARGTSFAAGLVFIPLRSRLSRWNSDSNR